MIFYHFGKRIRRRLGKKSKKKTISQFQLGCISYPVMNQNKVFKHQVDINMNSTFAKKMLCIKRVSKKYNTRVIALLMFWENKKTMIFKVLSSVIYCITDNYLCVDYIFLQQGLFSMAHKGF